MPDIYMLPVRSYLLDSLATTSMDVNPARNKKDFVVRQKGIVLRLSFRDDHTFVRP